MPKTTSLSFTSTATKGSATSTEGPTFTPTFSQPAVAAAPRLGKSPTEALSVPELTLTDELLSLTSAQSRHRHPLQGRFSRTSEPRLATLSATVVHYREGKPVAKRANITSNVLATVLGSEVAERIVSGTGATSTALTGLVSSPATTTRSLRVGAVARVVDCAFTEQDQEPSYMDLPVQTTLGAGRFSSYAGSALASTIVLIALPFMALLVVALAGRRNRLRET